MTSNPSWRPSLGRQVGPSRFWQGLNWGKVRQTLGCCRKTLKVTDRQRHKVLSGACPTAAGRAITGTPKRITLYVGTALYTVRVRIRISEIPKYHSPKSTALRTHTQIQGEPAQIGSRQASRSPGGALFPSTARVSAPGCLLVMVGGSDVPLGEFKK